MTRGTRTALLALSAVVALGPTSVRAQDEETGGRGEKVDGYAEWHVGECLLADGQKVCPGPGLKFKGGGEAKDVASIPLGYELKAKGKRLADGSLLATEIEAKPNGGALFEGEVKSATDAAEQRARSAGRFLEGAQGKEQSVGQLLENGPYVDRVRGIVDTLLPPYLHPEEIRVYAIQNKEWNAFAMGNYSIYVFTGLLDDMDDDEVAIVLGHELVHASHEHSRKQFKRQMWVQLLALGVAGAAETIDDEKKKAVIQLATGLAASAYSSGYGRGMEDQADRVGLRYAYEAGYDVTKGPRLWNRFAKKYGEGNKVANFFFSDHSLSAARASKLEKEIAFNYPDGPKADARAARRPAPAGTTVARASQAGSPAAAQALVSAPAALPLPAGVVRPAPPAAARPASVAQPTTARTEIEVGMSAAEVRRSLGAPAKEVVFGARMRWTYPDLTIVFENGKVVDVKF